MKKNNHSKLLLKNDSTYKDLIKIMKICLFFLFVFSFQLTATNTQAQDAIIEISNTTLSLDQFIREVEMQTNYLVVYSNSEIDTSLKINLVNKSDKVSKYLDRMLDSTDIDYDFDNNYIVLTKKENSISDTKSIETKNVQQVINITGKVVDENGEPVIGATIVLQDNTSIGTVTDIDGNFDLRNIPAESFLEFSYLGMKTQIVPVNGRAIINVELTPDFELLDELVVVGYGQQRKVSITGAVGSIKNENINKLANSSTAALQGLSPGLTILDRGGAPGRSNTTLRVRGITTINNSDALLLVDGVEQRISDINPDDIESISVLKDASTTAIYGSRAANGVILVTTKRGEEGKVKIDLNSYWGLQKVTDKPTHMETVAYMKQQNYAFENAGLSPRYSETFIQEWIDKHEIDPITYRKANQWQDVLYKDALQQNYSLNVSGGTDKAKGLLSLRYYKQDGVVPNFTSDIKEIRVNTDFLNLDRIKLSADANFRTRFSLEPVGAYDFDVNGGGIFYSMFHATQFVIPQYEDGKYGLGNKNANPIMLAKMAGDNKQWNNLFVGNIKAEIDLYNGLKIISQLAQRYAFNKTVSFTNAYQVIDNNFLDWGATARNEAYNPNPNRQRVRSISRNSMDDYRQDLDEYTLNLLLDYHTLIKKHDINLLGGFSQIENKWSHNQAYRQDFYNNEVQSINMGSESTWKAFGYNNEFALRSFFGRLNYNYDNRYLLEVNLRYDGTSRFTGNNQYGTFPSFSAGWRISNESFWSNSLRDIIYDLKIRGSWGKAGNQTAGLYAFYDSYTSTTYNFNNEVVQGYMQTALSNKELKWETSTQTNLGLDAGFFNNKLILTADYYYKRTDGILVNLPISGTIGLNAPVQNAAIVDNEGFELALDWRDNIQDFTYGIHFNISNNRNEVVSLGGANPTVSGNTSNVITTVREGYPINSFWGYKTDGLLTQKDIDEGYPIYDSRMTTGDVKYIDLNGDKKIDAEDMTVIGNEFPHFPFSFSSNLSWKGFDMSFMLQGVMNVQTRISGALAEGGNFEGFTLDIFEDHWTPERLDARFPRPRKSVDYNAMMSDFWIINAKYLRLKNIQLGYTIPTKISKKNHIEKARIYLAGSNVFTFTPLKEWGLDPEFISGRFLHYPQTSVYTIGINLTF